MIEVLSAARCIQCDLCVRVCPTNVFEVVPGGVPVIARHDDCQTCFQCEAYCPADAIFVAPLRTPAPEGSDWRDEPALARTGQLGLYRRRVGWGKDSGASGASDQSLLVFELLTQRNPATPRSHIPAGLETDTLDS